jgi:hypothetical protein
MHLLIGIALVAVLAIMSEGAFAAGGEKLQQFSPMSNLTTEAINQNASDMKKLSDKVNDIFKSSGYGADDCRTVCTTTMTLVNGKLVPSVSCSLQCGF